jgi:hypothetical protein
MVQGVFPLVPYSPHNLAMKNKKPKTGLDEFTEYFASNTFSYRR